MATFSDEILEVVPLMTVPSVLKLIDRWTVDESIITGDSVVFIRISTFVISGSLNFHHSVSFGDTLFTTNGSVVRGCKIPAISKNLWLNP